LIGKNFLPRTIDEVDLIDDTGMKNPTVVGVVNVERRIARRQQRTPVWHYECHMVVGTR